jgi:hypothetical protein
MGLGMNLPDFGKHPAGIAILTSSFALGRNLEKRLGRYTPKVRNAMITEWLAKRLFPRWQPYRREREIKTLMAALVVGLIVAGVITAILFFSNSMSMGR